MKESSKVARVTTLIVLALVTFCLLPTSIRAHPGSGIAVDPRGQIYFLDTGSGLWKIDTQGRVTHLSETRFHWLALDANDVFANGRLPSTVRSGLDWQIVKVGAHPTILLASDWPIAVGHDGNLYYQSGSPGHLRIMRSSPSGTTTVFANLPTTTSGQPLPHVSSLTAGPGGSLYYTENNAIRRITSRGLVGTVVTVPAMVGEPAQTGNANLPVVIMPCQTLNQRFSKCPPTVGRFNLTIRRRFASQTHSSKFKGE